MKTSWEQFAKRGARALGFQVGRIPTQTRWTAENLAALGREDVRTCIDVGVGTGTPVLYEAFPKAYHLLVEPLKEFLPDIERILQRYDGAHEFAAAGARAGSAEIVVELERLQMSSLHLRTALAATGSTTETRNITVVTLDSLVEKHELKPPFGLKIDTEGHELEVIRGAAKVISESKFLIVEASYAARFEDGYTLSDLTRELAARGFFLLDILEVGGLEPKFLDAVFVPCPR